LTVNSNLVRTEFWAVGLRNPWRFSIDPESGIIYCGDVGQEAREEVDIIVKGGNYGWNYWEGTLQRTNSLLIPAGFVHARPLFDYPRSQGFTVIGGVVYHGQRMSQINGAYIYGDYGSGRIWALRHTGTNVTQNLQLMADAGITAFGVDPSNGDILYSNQRSGNNGTVHRLVYSTNFTGTALPATLAATGAFTNLTDLSVAPGIVGYDINVPFWSDGAAKSRWFSVPNTNLTITFNSEGNWTFPTGTIWIKHFELELTNGAPSSRQRLETRLLVKNATGVYGVTYRWGNSLTNATLVPEGGLDEAFVIDDGGGILRTQVWHYPSRLECLTCHSSAGGLALGFNTPQMNHDYDYGGDVTNQLAALSTAGYFSSTVSNLHTLRALAHAANAGASLEYRVRSYLAANCVQCHQPSGAAQGLWDARITTPTASAGIINGPLVNDLGDPNNRVIKPGSLANSALLSRISIRGPGQMPPLASTVVDTQAVALVSAWITNDLPGYQTFSDWQIANFGSTNAPDGGADEDADGDGAFNYLEYLTATGPLEATNFWQIDIQQTNDVVQIVYPQIANRGFEVQYSLNLPAGGSWLPLNVPQNAPFFPATNGTAVVTDPNVTEPNKYYRVKVFAP
jgi:uncharacterized repeat protein (TIGR03806 family)